MNTKISSTILFFFIFSPLSFGKEEERLSINPSEMRTSATSQDPSFFEPSVPRSSKRPKAFALSEAQLAELFDQEEFEQIAEKICPIDSKSQCFRPIDDFLSDKKTHDNAQIKLLSKGNFGVVFQLNDRLVVKLLEVGDLIALENAFREINIGRKVFYSVKKNRIENLLQVVNCCSELHTREIEGELISYWRFFIFMPNMRSENLRTFVANPANFKHIADFSWRLKTLKAIAKGLVLLHEKNYSHRDVKLDNIFMENPDKAVIGDFGFAKKLLKTDEDFVGTEVYLPPEIEKGHSHFISADIFTFGLMIFELMNVTGYQMSENFKKDVVSFCNGYFSGKNPENFVPNTLKDLEKHVYCSLFDKQVLKMISENPEERPKIKQIFRFLEAQAPLMANEVHRRGKVGT